MIRVMAVPQERGAPAWSVRLAADLDANDQAARKLVAELTEEQLNWQPTPGSWSVGQCLEHLCMTNEAYLPPISVVVNEKPDSPVEQITPGWFGRWFIRSFIEPSPVTKRAPASAKIRPTAHVGASVLERFLAGNESCRELMVGARAPNRQLHSLLESVYPGFDSPSVPDSRSLSAMNAVIFFKPRASCIPPGSLTSSLNVED